ncbi:MAG: GNAT family protein [Anaerolineaceae bacterium]|nr:GNAT family protein [Anaerolineaceae bacterium]
MTVNLISLPFETPRLILRAFRPEDAAAFSAYRSDPEVARYQGWTAPYSLQQAQEFVAEMMRTIPGTPGEWYQIALEEKVSGQVIGDVAFHIEANSPQQAILGITLASAYQSKGYATEAMQRLLQFLFEELKLHRVSAYIDVDNPASYHLLERLGFRREGHFVENTWFKGAWGSEYFYALLGREWQQRNKNSA